MNTRHLLCAVAIVLLCCSLARAQDSVVRVQGSLHGYKGLDKLVEDASAIAVIHVDSRAYFHDELGWVDEETFKKDRAIPSIHASIYGEYMVSVVRYLKGDSDDLTSGTMRLTMLTGGVPKAEQTGDETDAVVAHLIRREYGDDPFGLGPFAKRGVHLVFISKFHYNVRGQDPIPRSLPETGGLIPLPKDTADYKPAGATPIDQVRDLLRHAMELAEFEAQNPPPSPQRPPPPGFRLNQAIPAP